MNSKTYAEKIRRRKQQLKQINAELNSPLKKKWKSRLQVISTAALFAVLILVIFTYKGQLPEGWSNYENLMLPISLFFPVSFTFNFMDFSQTLCQITAK